MNDNQVKESHNPRILIRKGARAPLAEIGELRYKVFSDEKGLQWEGADPAHSISDRLDQTATHFLIQSPSKLVGGARIHFGKSGQLDCHEEYRRLLGYRPGALYATVSRFVVDSSFRGPSVFRRTAIEMLRFIQSQGVYAILVNVDPKMVHTLERVGFGIIDGNFHHPLLHKQTTPMCVLLRHHALVESQQIPLVRWIKPATGNQSALNKLCTDLPQVIK